ncbi:MAG: hypothetical protein ACRDRZ_10540 [Pseudonocardiaceae bacterium]
MTLDEALADLLGPDHPPADRDTLVAAMVEAWRRRHRNTDAGAAIIDALAEHYSFREIEQMTGVPRTTAHRWSRRPGADDEPPPE